jgi:hypothetical protein
LKFYFRKLPITGFIVVYGLIKMLFVKFVLFFGKKLKNGLNFLQPGGLLLYKCFFCNTLSFCLPRGGNSVIFFCFS